MFSTGITGPDQWLVLSNCSSSYEETNISLDSMAECTGYIYKPFDGDGSILTVSVFLT